MEKKDINIYLLLLTTLVIPILIGFFIENFSEFRFVSVPLHSTLESIGGIVAFIISFMIVILYSNNNTINHLHMASLALITMGTFDIFHAITNPGELFVWLHSLAIFFGGIVFALVWLPNIQLNRRNYILIPFVVFFVSLLISVVSLLNPSLVPQMLDKNNNFTYNANLLNIIGGIMFIIASLYFIKQYLEDENFDDLLFAGHTMLFGSAGILFFFSTIWDIQWWFWHSLRLLAYGVSVYFIFKIFYQNLRQLTLLNQDIVEKNTTLAKNIKLLEEYKKAIYEGSIISASNLSGHITYVNDKLLELTGYTQEELIGKPHSIFRDPTTPKAIFKEMWDTIKNKKPYKGLIKNKRKDGKFFYVKITIVPIVDLNGDIHEYLAFRDDVTELVESQYELKNIFYTDTLTKLHNRFKLHDDLKIVSNPHIALLNIDNFKGTNDFYGEAFGDQVLIYLSDYLLDFAYRNNFKLYRNHGDEFVIVSSDYYSFEVFLQNIEKLVKELENESFKISDSAVDLNFSVGILENSNDIIKADLALKEAKNTKKSIVCYTNNSQVEKQFKTNMEWSKKIKNALNDDRFEIALQPLYSNNTSTIDKYEALIRLVTIDGEVISPYLFLNVAKQTKLYGQITRTVIRKVFKLLETTSKGISINLCVEDIFEEETREYLLNMLRNSKNSHKVTIELVESESIESFVIVKEFLDNVKTFGVKLAIDDFGTGYSNFEYLLKLEVDFIKIDGSMIKNINSDKNSYNVVETIVSFAKKNNIKVVAEFVATQEIQERVKELGIDYSQGYFIDEPKFWKDIV